MGDLFSVLYSIENYIRKKVRKVKEEQSRKLPGGLMISYYKEHQVASISSKSDHVTLRRSLSGNLICCSFGHRKNKSVLQAVMDDKVYIYS